LQKEVHDKAHKAGKISGEYFNKASGRKKFMYRIQSEGGIADHKSNLQAQLSFSPGNRISLLMPSIIILRSAQ
jgi:hypothetical protein